MRRVALALATLIVMTFTMSGCGQKGGLTRPEQTEFTAVVH